MAGEVSGFRREDGVSFEAQIKLNFDQVMGHINDLSENRGSLYVDVATGSLKFIKSSDANLQNWTAVHLDLGTDKTKLQSSVPKDATHQTARAVLKATSQALNIQRNQVKEEQGLDHLPTLEETQRHLQLSKVTDQLQAMSIKSQGLQVSQDELDAIGSCFPDMIDSLQDIHSFEELAQVLTKHARERLEDFEAVDQEEIKAIYKLLNLEQVKFFCEEQASSDYHPTIVFKHLYEAVIAFEEDPASAKVSTAPAGEFLGVNGSYFLNNREGQKLWIFKPADEEMDGLMAGVPAGEGAKREHLACLLNHHENYPIPYTAYIKIGGQEGSAQRFVSGCKGVINYQTMPGSELALAGISAVSVQASVVFDIRFNNWDRHMGNLMCRAPEGEEPSLFMIDHGCILSASSEDQPKFEQLSMDQMHRQLDPSLAVLFSEETIRKDVEILRKHKIAEPAIDRMLNATIILKHTFEISISMREAKKPEISAYDLGLIALKQSELFWSEAGVSQIKATLDSIAPTKETLLSFKPTQQRVRGMQMRKAAVREHGETKAVKLLYGSDQNDPDQSISWGQSILGHSGHFMAS